jgi:2-dehydropantoate 2-reductase
MTMKIAILGIGAMGCLFAALLEPVADPILVGSWPEQIAAIRNRGLRLVGPDGRESDHRIAVTNDYQDVGQASLALVLVKSRQTGRAAEAAAKILLPDGLAVTLQNGLNNLSRLETAVGVERTALGVTSEGATLLAPGLVRHAGRGKTYLAHGAFVPGRVRPAYELFRAAGLETYLVENADDILWAKLAVNAAINPLTALLRVPNGLLAENEQTRELMRQIAAEVAAVAQAQGIKLPAREAGERAIEVAEATAANHSSMLQDILRGVPTEIGAICGAVVESGERLNIATPLNGRLLELVQGAETGNWPLDRAGDIKQLMALINKPIDQYTNNQQ